MGPGNLRVARLLEISAPWQSKAPSTSIGSSGPTLRSWRMEIPRYPVCWYFVLQMVTVYHLEMSRGHRWTSPTRAPQGGTGAANSVCRTIRSPWDDRRRRRRMRRDVFWWLSGRMLMFFEGWNFGWRLWHVMASQLTAFPNRGLPAQSRRLQP